MDAGTADKIFLDHCGLQTKLAGSNRGYVTPGAASQEYDVVVVLRHIAIVTFSR